MNKKFYLITIAAIFSIAICGAQSVDSLKVENLVVENLVVENTPTEKTSIMEKVINWYDHNMNYTTITALMTIESSFIPFPSEIVVPPAAAISVQPDSKLNIYLVVLFATIGAILGALINYVLSMTLGRVIIYKFADSKLGRMCLLSSEKIQKAEAYFNDHGAVSTFVGRLIPGIRQLISVPAGLARMPLLPFILYTAIGAGIWNAVLAVIGYIVGDNMELINQYSHQIGAAILIVIVLCIVIYAIKKFVKTRGNN